MYFLCFLFALADPAQETALLQQGLAALQQGRLEEARHTLEQAAKIDSGNPYAWASLAETYLKLKDPQQALAAARTAEKTGAQDPIVCHALAMYYAESGNAAKAAQLEGKFAESPKADPEATARAAGLYLNAGNPADALALARKAVQQQPSAAHEDLLGRSLIAAGQVDAGFDHLRSAWQLERNNPVISFDYAQALLRKEDFGTASEVLASALEAHAEDSQLVLAMGVARYGQRRFEEAIVLFLRVVHLDPAIQQPYAFLGQLLDQAGPHLSEITAAYQTWIQREPNSAKANFFLAKALLVAGSKDQEAERLLRRSISLDGQRWESHYELGLLAVKKHDYPAALNELTRSADLSPSQPAVHYQLARVYDRLSQPEKAKAEREAHAKLLNSPAVRPGSSPNIPQ